MTILYFIAEPTAEQLAFAQQHKMAIRNPRAYSPSDYIEPCDFVYGEVPQAYLDRFPLFELPELEKGNDKKPKKAEKADGEPTT